jgi:hypothetical protein
VSITNTLLQQLAEAGVQVEKSSLTALGLPSITIELKIKQV